MNSQDYNLIISGNVLSHETFTPTSRFCDFQIQKNNVGGIFLTANKWQKVAENNCGQYSGVTVVVAVAVAMAVYHFS